MPRDHFLKTNMSAVIKFIAGLALWAVIIAAGIAIVSLVVSILVAVIPAVAAVVVVVMLAAAIGVGFAAASSKKLR